VFRSLVVTLELLDQIVIYHPFLGAILGPITAEDINKLLEKLNFSEEEATKVVSTKLGSMNSQGFEAWAIGKIMSVEKVNREAMYRVFKSLWFTKEEVNFVALKEGAILVKFGNVEDKKRILNLSPWLFDQCLFAMLPYVKRTRSGVLRFQLNSIWVRIFSIPLEYMDTQVAMDVGSAIREVIATGWHDREGGWTEYIRLRVILDIFKPLRRVVQFVNSESVVYVCAIKYERLPIFCYSCGLISYSTQKCDKKGDLSKSNNTSFQYGNWLRAHIGMPNQNRGYWRNGVEVIVAKKAMESELNGETQGNEEINESVEPKGKEKTKQIEEESRSRSPMEKCPTKLSREGCRKMRNKRKRARGSCGELTEESPSRTVRRKLLDGLSPLKAGAGRTNEVPMLELSWDGEPCDSSGA
ncbi:hypothetical protein Goshw_014377, partial [Gossypium schwendimanii]|nr:hypothetical protein [Gossypium schwendimanii]